MFGFKRVTFHARCIMWYRMQSLRSRGLLQSPANLSCSRLQILTVRNDLLERENRTRSDCHNRTADG
jgi:hypothetical protein